MICKQDKTWQGEAVHISIEQSQWLHINLNLSMSVQFGWIHIISIFIPRKAVPHMYHIRGEKHCSIFQSCCWLPHYHHLIQCGDGRSKRNTENNTRSTSCTSQYKAFCRGCCDLTPRQSLHTIFVVSNYFSSQLACPITVLEFHPKYSLLAFYRELVLRTITLCITVLDGCLTESRRFCKLGIHKIHVWRMLGYKLPWDWAIDGATFKAKYN